MLKKITKVLLLSVLGMLLVPASIVFADNAEQNDMGIGRDGLWRASGSRNLVEQTSSPVELRNVLSRGAVETFVRLGLGIEEETLIGLCVEPIHIFNLTKHSDDGIVRITESDLHTLIDAFIALDAAGMRITNWDADFTNALKDAGIFLDFIEGKRVIYRDDVQRMLEELAMLPVDELQSTGWVYSLYRRGKLEAFAELRININPTALDVLDVSYVFNPNTNSMTSRNLAYSNPSIVSSGWHSAAIPRITLSSGNFWRSSFPLISGDFVSYNCMFTATGGRMATGAVNSWGGIDGANLQFHHPSPFSPATRSFTFRTNASGFTFGISSEWNNSITVSSGSYQVFW